MCGLISFFIVTGHLRKDIVTKLTTIPNFLDKILVQNLRQSIPIALNAVNSTLTNLIPLNFQTYLKFDTQSIAEALDKVVDVTSKYVKQCEYQF